MTTRVGLAKARHQRLFAFELRRRGFVRMPCDSHGMSHKLARPEGFEPPTPRFVVWCSAAVAISSSLKARFYLPLPDPRNSDANTLRTSDWEIPNCFAMREGVIPALKVARTAFTWPSVNAVLGSSGCCRRSDDSPVAIDGSDARSPA